jgi:hypothetical protein
VALLSAPLSLAIDRPSQSARVHRPAAVCMNDLRTIITNSFGRAGE